MRKRRDGATRRNISSQESLEWKKKNIEAMIEADGQREFFSKLTQLTETRVSQIVSGIEITSEESGGLRRRIAGFEKNVDTNDETVMMQQ